MRIVLTCALIATVAACPKKSVGPGGAGGPGPAPLGVGCPAAQGVYVASFVQPLEGEQGHRGWVLPLHDAKVASIEGQPAFAMVDAAVAAAAGVPAAPPIVWLLPPGAAMCQATVGRHYAATIDGPTPNIAYGVELTGCAEPADPADAVAIALASTQPPSECRAILPKPVAARLGDHDPKGAWTRPTAETPIPPGFGAVIPPTTCAAPDCEQLWSIAQVELDGATVAWAGAVNWLHIPPGAGADTQCTWRTDTFSGYFVAGPGGAPVKITDGQDHPLALTAVLADRAGAKVLLASGLGEYAAYDLAAGTATLGRHLVWLLDHPEAYEPIDRLGPYCRE